MFIPIASFTLGELLQGVFVCWYSVDDKLSAKLENRSDGKLFLSEKLFRVLYKLLIISSILIIITCSGIVIFIKPIKKENQGVSSTLLCLT